VRDPFNLQRFIDAQSAVYDRVVKELRSGRKQSHWMWFMFPQIAGLGHSAMAQKYAITSLNEAAAYLDDPILGPRLRKCTSLVNAIENCSIEDIFGYPDDLKFRSSMTLFLRATKDNHEFVAALAKYFKGEPDTATLNQLRSLHPST
jgi:uncharacterized protein (DUF1810 family)